MQKLAFSCLPRRSQTDRRMPRIYCPYCPRGHFEAQPTVIIYDSWDSTSCPDTVPVLSPPAKCLPARPSMKPTEMISEPKPLTLPRRSSSACCRHPADMGADSAGPSLCTYWTAERSLTMAPELKPSAKTISEDDFRVVGRMRAPATIPP